MKAVNKMNLGQKIGVRVTRGNNDIVYTNNEDQIPLSGRFRFEQWRDGKLIADGVFPNAIKNAAKNSLFDTMFNLATQVSTGSWCIGIIDNASFSAEAAGDTIASHAGWIEFTGYSQANRVAWGQGAASGQAIVNASAAVFDITASSGTLYGIFVVSQNTKGGTTGLLWTTGGFPSVVPVVSGDQIKIIYQIAA